MDYNNLTTDEMLELFNVACDDKEHGYKTVEMLLDKGVNINQPLDTDLNTPIIYSLLMDNAKIFSLLYDNNTDLNIPNMHGTTPLMVSVMMKEDNTFYDIDIIRKLLDKGANPNAATIDSKTTALHSVSEIGNNTFVSLLLTKKYLANINQQNINGSTALNLAVEFEHLDTVKILLENGADPNIPDVHNVTAIFSAVSENLYEITNELLKKKANPNVWNNDGFSPICMAVMRNPNTNILELLLDNGADINDKSKLPEGTHTPLHEAVYQLNVVFIKYLLERGANYNIKNFKGLTPLQLLEKGKEREELAKLNMEVTIAEHDSELLIINDCINTFKEFISKSGTGVSAGGGAGVGGTRRRRKTRRHRRQRKPKTTKNRRKKGHRRYKTVKKRRKNVNTYKI
jgi:ankyrin repeat protein